MTDTTPLDTEVDATVDCSGQLCPLPVYQAGLELQKLQPGQVLKLVCTDPGSLEDIPALARQRGDRILKSTESGRTQTFWLEKGPGA